MARHSHLDAPNAEEGLQMYMATCGASGLKSVQRVARSYKATPKAKRLERYIAEFEDEARWGEQDDVLGDLPSLAEVAAQLGCDEDEVLAVMEAEGLPIPEDWQQDEPVSEQENMVERLAALLGANAQGGGSSVATKTRQGRRQAPAEGFVVGATFSYRNNGGNTSEHTIERIAGGRAYTDTGKRFKISTLESLMGDVVNIV